MTTTTRDALCDLCDKVAILAHATVLTIGLDTATDIINSAQQAKHALNHDPDLTRPTLGSN